jgi:hypothetical protein
VDAQAGPGRIGERAGSLVLRNGLLGTVSDGGAGGVGLLGRDNAVGDHLPATLLAEWTYSERALFLQRVCASSQRVAAEPV